MPFLTISLGVLLTIISIHFIQLLFNRGKNKLPPGPIPLPIIGNLHLLGDLPHKSLAKLAKTYGPLMFLRLGQKSALVISSSTMAKEVLQKQDLAFSSRNIIDSFHAQNHCDYSVVLLPVASRWRSLRKIMNSNIFSGKRLDARQELRCRKVQELVDYCRQNSQTGAAVDVGRAAFVTTLNLLSNTIFSRDLTDPFSDTAKEFKELVRNIMIENGKPNLSDLFPLLQKFDPQGIKGRTTVHFGKIIDLFSGLIDERLEKQKSLHDADNDVLDALLKASQDTPEEIDRTHMEHLFLDMFVAGTDTTSTTVEWAMAEALKNPEVMKNAKSELEKVIGKGKVVNEQDIPGLPYLRCMVKETLRVHPSVPFLIPRRVDQDVELCGYTVPKSTQVLVNVWAIGRDDAVWDNPLEFRPERFLESEMDVKGLDFELIPFGAGRRICPGLPLAIRMVPVMVGSLLNAFDWKLDGGIGPTQLDMDEKFGIALQKAIPLRAVPIPL